MVITDLGAVPSSQTVVDSRSCCIVGSFLALLLLLQSAHASPKSRKKFEATTEVRRSSRARNTVSYKESGLATRFCKEYLPPREVKMVLEDEDGAEFDTVYIGNRTGLSGGWRGFSLHHNLEDGDSLVFELVESDRFKIYILKAIDEDADEAEPDGENDDVGTKDTDPTEEEADKDSPVAQHRSDSEPPKGAKRRKLRGRR